MPSMSEINKFKKRFSGASFFSGCGGSSTGHKMAGINIMYANEFIPAAQDTYVANHTSTILDRRDVRKVSAKEVLAILGLKKGQLDLLDGSPPCKSFSTAGKRDKGWNKAAHYSDGVHQRTDDLFKEFIRLLSGLMPKTFVIENVPGMVKGSAKGMFLETLKELKACGYEVKAAVLNASQLGVPQARERLIFVGVRNDLVKMGLQPVFPKPHKGPPPSVKAFLPHIVALKGKVQGNVLTYIQSDVPSPTITASDSQNSETAAFSGGGFVETSKGERRKYKISELKKICAFPDDFKFTGTYEQRFERMGRAVPPMMMAHVTASIVEHVLEPFYEKHGKAPYGGALKPTLTKELKAFNRELEAVADKKRKELTDEEADVPSRAPKIAGTSSDVKGRRSEEQLRSHKTSSVSKISSKTAKAEKKISK